MNDTIDREWLEEAAQEALTRPDDYAAWDERWYTTHGLVASWADRGDDLIAESNFATMVRLLEEKARPDTDDVVETSAGHWAFGSVRELFVRVKDDDGNFTPAFIEAVNLTLALQEYSILDEEDHAEREHEAFEEDLKDTLGDIAHRYWLECDDTDEDSDAIKALFDEAAEDEDLHVDDQYRFADNDKVKDLYVRMRNEYYEARAQDHLGTVPEAQIPGQGELEI